LRKILITKKEIEEIKNQYTETLKIVTENFSTFIKYKSGTINTYVLNEEVKCLCPNGTESINCCKTDLTLNKHVSDSIKIVNYAINKGLDLKDKASDSRYQTTWSDVVKVSQLEKIKDLLPNIYNIFVPEIVSGLSPGFSFNKELIDLAADISDLSGLRLKITGGNDRFHHDGIGYVSDHQTGDAIDVVPIAGMNPVNDKKIEEAVISLISSGKYGKKIGFINERLHSSGAATAPHFHISLTTSPSIGWFGYIDKNGKSYSKLPSTSTRLMWNRGKYPELTKSYHNTDEKDVKPTVMQTKYQPYKDGDIYIPAGNISDKTRVNNTFKKGL
jgi:hypothetical protein